MTELDFDELDKAVNSLMTDTKPTANTPTTTDDSQQSPTTVPPVETPEAPVESTSEPTPSSEPAKPSLATKRRGQFMDVMHPSSDMKSASNTTKRQGVTITPSASAVATTSESSSEPAVAPESAVDTPAEVAPVIPQDIEPSTVTNTQPQMGGDVAPTGTPSEPSTPDMPDPIDVAMGTNETHEAPETPPAPATPETPPLDSPFLPDAKPEKRPLGALAQDVSSDGEKDAQVQADPTAVTETAVLPDELHDNVVGIESDTTTPPPEPTPTPAPAAPVAPSGVTAPATGATVATPVAEAPATGNGSIVQQYQEQPSSGDQTNGAIYDTDSYHKGIEGDARGKKGSVLKWVIWIVVLLVVGAAAGAGYFLLTR